MAGFGVTPEALERTGAEITKVRAGASGPGVQLGDPASFGHSAVGAACAEFTGRWRAADVAMAAELERLAASLTTSARAYSRVEQQVGRLLLGLAPEVSAG